MSTFRRSWIGRKIWAQDGETEPLLASAESAPPTTPLPAKQIAILCMMRFGEPIAMMLIFPFINQMIEDLGVTDDPRKVGVYAGAIESLFALTTFMTILPWGRLSDRIGRKPVLMMGLTGVSLSVALFGMSRSYPMMVVARCLGGLLNGNVAVLKSVLGEITDETNQGRAFSFLPLAWSLGSIAGPIFGGYLSRPVDKYPALFGGNAFLTKFPYALPCLVGAFFPAVSAIIGFFFLEETLKPSTPTRTKLARRPSSASAHATFVATTSTTIPAPPTSNASDITLPPAEEDEEDKAPPSLKELMTKNIFCVLLVYCCLSLETVALDALLILFCYTRVSVGGLGWHEADIGRALSVAGILAVLAQVVLFPPLQKRFGSVRVYRAGMALYPIVFSLFPVLNWLARKDEETGRSQSNVWGVMMLFMTLKSTANIVYGCNMLVVTSAAPSRRLLGSINGIAQMCASLMRAIGPFFSTSLFVISIENGLLGGNFVFVFMVGLALAGFGATFLLQEGVHGWREAKEVEVAEERTGSS